MGSTQHIADAPTPDLLPKLDLIVETMREMSKQTDPQAMIKAYTARMRKLMPVDRTVWLSRRDLVPQKYRITRTDLWKEEINPWRERARLPVLEGGLLGKLIYGDEPVLIDDLEVDDDDPGAVYFAGQRSLLAVPYYDMGQSLNMVVFMRKEPGAFAAEQFPQWVWLSNLFGQATHNLIRSQKLQEAYESLDREMKIVEQIQHSLLPADVPTIPTLDLAIHYQTSRRAGGDYYDFFPLPGGKWGILIADVSGHGTPAAVLMAVTHSIAHTLPGPAEPPGALLEQLNRHLTARYTKDSGTFVTAFYGIYDPAARQITYASAGHNPPRVKRCADGTRTTLDGTQRLPLGISDTETYPEKTFQLQPGDQIVFYTDGVTEAEDPSGRLFGIERLDRVLAGCENTAPDVLQAVLGSLANFTAGHPADDDRTLIAAKVS
jgi:phosphoserine phosphatase RsbU/P